MEIEMAWHWVGKMVDYWVEMRVLHWAEMMEIVLYWAAMMAGYLVEMSPQMQQALEGSIL